jgi:hypothetical protein
MDSTFSPEQLAAAQTTLNAAASRTPSRVLDAFFPEIIVAAGLTLQPFTLGSYMLLEKVGSPLISGGDVRAADVATAAVLLSLPAARARSLAADRAALDAAAFDFADRLAPTDLATLGERIAQHLNAAFATVPGGGTSTLQEEDVLGKPAPSAPASAGV